jgi:hypothetical protein
MPIKQRKGFGLGKPRSRHHEKVQRAARQQTRRHGRVGTETVLGAGKRSSRRAKDPQSMETAQATLQQVDLTTQGRFVDWSNRGNPVHVLRKEIDPRYAQQYAVQTYALRTDRSLEQVTSAVAESEAGATVNVLSRKAGAALKKEEGFSKTYTLKDGGRQKIVRTGAQVRAKEERDRKLRALPKQKRPTYASQTTIGHGLRFQGAGSQKRVVKSTHARGPPSKRSFAEISAQAQAQRVTGPDARGNCRMKIPKSLFSDKDLVRMGFPRPRDNKPKRAFDFSGPTAKADADAFDETMMEWLENPNRVKPPPHLRKS